MKVKNVVLFKWLGYDSKLNSWIPESSIKNIASVIMAGFDDFEMGERDEELKSYSNEKQNEYTELESEYSKLYDDYHMP